MVYKDFFAPNEIEYIEKIENIFLKNGLERMSKYFYDIVFENNVPASHILWDQDERYYIIGKMTNSSDMIHILCSDNICGEYETLDSFFCALTDEQIQNKIKDALEGWTPQQEKILKKYIDLEKEKKFPYTIQSVVLRVGTNKSIVIRNADIENSRTFYTEALDLEVDKYYYRYLECIDDEDYDSGIQFLCKAYQEAYNRFGESHKNTVAILYDFLYLAQSYMTAKESLQINMHLYKYNKREYGYNHISTISCISSIASDLSSLGKNEDGIVLARYVAKALKRKYGKYDKRSIKALNCLFWHYYSWEKYGKALTFAEECLDLSEKAKLDNIFEFHQNIAMIYRTGFLGGYEKALEHDLIAHSYLQQDTVEFLNSMDNISLDYCKLGCYIEAVNTQSELVETAINLYGQDTLETLGYMINLATTLSSAERHEDAWKIDKYVYSCYYHQLGAFHEKTMEAKNNFIIDCVNLGQREYAMKLAGSEYLERNKHFGPQHQATQYSMQQYLDLRDEKW